MARVLLFTTMGLVALAIAAPAGASASGMFYHEGDPITIEGHIPYRGYIGFVIVGVGSFTCDVHATVEFATNQGHVDQIELTTSTCAGFGVIMENCELEGHELTESVSLTPTATDIDISNFKLYMDFKPGCIGGALNEIEITDDPLDLVSWDPDDHQSLSFLEIVGSTILDRINPPAPAITAKAIGLLEGSGTYGLTASK